jgi:hypothetical protein
MGCTYCRKSLDGLKIVDHPLNVKQQNTYLGGVTDRQVYQCSWCDEYWMITTISSAWMGKKLSQSIEPKGYNLDKIQE